jgi:hypothetical protein
MERVVEEKVKEYAYKHYPNRFGKKELIVTDAEKVFYIKSNKDESPLILSKDILG